MYGVDLAVVATYASLAISAAGAGYSVYSSNQAAKQQSSIAQYNYSMQMREAQQAQQFQMMQAQQAQQQSQVMQQQAAQQVAQAQINNALAQSEAQARVNNAEMIRQTAETQTIADRSNIRNQRADNARLQAIQRAKIAGSGTVESGSPLELLADTAGLMEQALNESHYQSDLGRRQALGQAAMEDFGGQLAKSGAFLGLNADLANAANSKIQADFMQQSSEIDKLKAASGYSLATKQANINLMSGNAQASATKMESYGTLLQNVGSLGSQVANFAYKAPAGTKTPVGAKAPAAKKAPAKKVAEPAARPTT